jgi:hypothetical protein
VSTKIYTAYRTRRRGVDLFALVADLRHRAERACTRSLRKEHGECDGSMTMETSMALAKQYREQASKAERNPFNFDAAIAIRAHESRYYLIPYADRLAYGIDVFAFLAKHPALEEYGYWNNTDRPDHVSDRAWSRRAKTWGAMLDGDHEHDKVILDIVSPDSFGRVDPFWVDFGKRTRAARRIRPR